MKEIDNIDSLLVDMIDLGLCDPRVNLNVYILYKTKEILYCNIKFPGLDKKKGNIDFSDIINELIESNIVIGNNPRLEFNLEWLNIKLLEYYRLAILEQVTGGLQIFTYISTKLQGDIIYDNRIQLSVDSEVTFNRRKYQ